MAAAAKYDVFVAWHEQHFQKVGTTVFLAVPMITSLDPTHGPYTGATLVTITGQFPFIEHGNGIDNVLYCVFLEILIQLLML